MRRRVQMAKDAYGWPYRGEMLRPEHIRTDSFRDAYKKAAELNAMHDRGNGLARWVCSKNNFRPGNFIRFFHARRKFSGRQIEFINNVWKHFNDYRKANNEFSAQGLRRELDDLAKEAGIQLDSSVVLYGEQFAWIRNSVIENPELSGKLEMLETRFFEIYNGIKNGPEGI